MQVTSKEFRHSHLLNIISDMGTIEAVASKTGLNPQYLSQLKNRTRGIGDKTARKIEASMGWPEGAMDRPPDGENLDDELAYLLKTMPEKDVIHAIVDVVPGMSEAGLREFTAALLSRLNNPANTQE